MFVELFNKALIKDTIKNKRDKNNLSPTDAFRCKRQILYQLLGIENEDYIISNPQLMNIFQNGNYSHKKFQEIMKEYYKNVEVEKRLELPIKFEKNGKQFEFLLTGYIDLILEKKNKQKAIIELKTHKDWLINGRNYLPREKIEHKGQVMLYMYATGIKEAYIVYENKNTNELKEFKIEYNQRVVDSILDDFKEVWFYFKEQKIPEREDKYNETKYPCSYCPFKKICYKKE